MTQENREAKKNELFERMVEGRKMDAYTEGHTSDMHACWVCDTVCYKKKPAKQIGGRWICIDCMRQLKETLDNLTQWEEEVTLGEEAHRQLDGDLGI